MLLEKVKWIIKIEIVVKVNKKKLLSIMNKMIFINKDYIKIKNKKNPTR